jgi:hypothetical protein
MAYTRAPLGHEDDDPAMRYPGVQFLPTFLNDLRIFDDFDPRRLQGAGTREIPSFLRLHAFFKARRMRAYVADYTASVCRRLKLVAVCPTQVLARIDRIPLKQPTVTCHESHRSNQACHHAADDGNLPG